MRIELEPVGQVESPLLDPADAPNQGDEGGPEAWIAIRPELADALDGLQVGDAVVVLTWLDRADRSVLRVHPRSDPDRPQQGVFTTRSPDRPNPIGLHEVRVVQVELDAAGPRVRVADLEAVDGTPVLDLKPVLGPPTER